jgi:hypothetical protein
VQVLIDWTKCDAAGIERCITAIHSMRPERSTNLMAGINSGFGHSHADEVSARRAPVWGRRDPHELLVRARRHDLILEARRELRVAPKELHVPVRARQRVRILEPVVEEVDAPVDWPAWHGHARSAPVSDGEANKVDAGDRVLEPRVDKVRDVDARVCVARA